MNCDKFKIKHISKCKTENELFKDREKFINSNMPMLISGISEMLENEKNKELTTNKEQNKMNNYNKGITISIEELKLIGLNIESAINNRTTGGTSPENFKVLKELKKRIEESKK